MKFVKLASTVLALSSILPNVIALTFKVLVGQQVFQPEFLNVSNGDIIAFTFISKTHSVTQSSFQQPCQRVQGGFDSGNITVTVPHTNTFVVPIENDNIPLWVFSESDDDCSQGMVFAANVDQQVFQQFQQRARQTGRTTQEPQAEAAEQLRAELEQQQATQNHPLRGQIPQLKQQINQLLAQLIRLLTTLSQLGQQETLEARKQQLQNQLGQVEEQGQQAAQIEQAEQRLEKQEATLGQETRGELENRRRRFARRLN